MFKRHLRHDMFFFFWKQEICQLVQWSVKLCCRNYKLFEVLFDMIQCADHKDNAMKKQDKRDFEKVKKPFG